MSNGGTLTEADFKQFGAKVKTAIDKARRIGLVTRSPAAEAVWDSWYMNQPDDVPGLVGAVTSRDDAIVLPLSLVYALLDGSRTIHQELVVAAIAVWDYCHESAQMIFGATTGDADVDRRFAALTKAGGDGITRTRQQEMFNGNYQRADRTREASIQQGLAIEHSRPATTRPERVLHLIGFAPTV